MSLFVIFVDILQLLVFMITVLTKDLSKQIDDLFEDYKNHRDVNKLKQSLEFFRYPDGTLSLYIREKYLALDL